MKYLILILFPFLCVGQLPPDKLKHALVGEAITAATGYSMYHLTNRVHYGFFFGVLSGSGANAAKELIYDKAMHKGTPDTWDWVAGSFGSIKSGLTLIVVIDQERKHNKKNNYFNFKNYDSLTVGRN